MAYADHSDIEAEFPGTTFATGNNITDTIVDGYCNQESTVIDSYIGRRYTVPVTSGSDALLFLKSICIKLVAARVGPKLMIGNAEQRSAKFEEAEAIRDGALKMLEEIRDRKASIPGLTESGASPVAKSYNTENDYTPPFTLDQEF